MAVKKTDLLDDILAVAGQKPVDLNIGGHTIRIRRAHTGVQVVEWQNIEVKRADARATVLESKATDAEKLDRLAIIGADYLKDMLTFLSEQPTAEEDIDAVCELLGNTSGQVMSKVMARIFTESGLFNDKGEHVPFIQPSETESNTDD